jgi:hypothetical protein
MKTEEFGRADINEHKIYIKFGCNEDHSNKTTSILYHHQIKDLES